MKKIAVLVAFAVALVASLPAGAADLGGSRVTVADASRARVLPFPRSSRAQAVWASDTCWNACQSYCTWGEAGCLQADSQGRCLKRTDACNRYCQRDCRTRGGPLLTPLFDALD
ncbi:MAG: hypothetical protein ACK4UO_03510 [Pseudolabrys sp.]